MDPNNFITVVQNTEKDPAFDALPQSYFHDRLRWIYSIQNHFPHQHILWKQNGSHGFALLNEMNQTVDLHLFMNIIRLCIIHYYYYALLCRLTDETRKPLWSSHSQYRTATGRNMRNSGRVSFYSAAIVVCFLNFFPDTFIIGAMQPTLTRSLAMQRYREHNSRNNRAMRTN